MAEQHWLDDSLCNALVAARQGVYDGLTAEQHLEMLVGRVRERAATPPYNENGDLVTKAGQVFRQVGWQIHGGPKNGFLLKMDAPLAFDASLSGTPHGGYSPVYIEVGTD